MPAEAKKAAPHTRPSSLVSLMLGWVQQGMDSFLATQRILLDFATKKNASVMKGLREGVVDPENSPVAILTELAVEATANFTEAQRILLNLAQQENEIVMNGVKERVGGLPIAATMADRARRGIDTFIEMQQDFLTLFSKHAQRRLQAGMTADTACVTEATRDAMEHFVRTQKKFLDVLIQDGAKAKAGDAKKKTEVTKLAREAADAFIDTQKKLLDLAGQQVNVNLQAAGRTVDMMRSLRPLPLPNISGEQVKDFIDAEKALLESIVKPKPGSAPKAAAKKRPARKPAAAQAANAGA
jgi:hypothetical protein